MSTRKHRKVQDSTLSHWIQTTHLKGNPSECCTSPEVQTPLACLRHVQTALCLNMGTAHSQDLGKNVGCACCRATIAAALATTPHAGVSVWPASANLLNGFVFNASSNLLVPRSFSSTTLPSTPRVGAQPLHQELGLGTMRPPVDLSLPIDSPKMSTHTQRCSSQRRCFPAECSIHIGQKTKLLYSHYRRDNCTTRDFHLKFRPPCP